MTTKESRHLEMLERLAKRQKLTDQQVTERARLTRAANDGRHFVRVQKLQLRPGEELWDFASALNTAVRTNRIVLADGSLDVWLEGVYEDHVIVQDGNTGRLYRSDYQRNAQGEFSFSAPVEVQVAFVPVSEQDQDSGAVQQQKFIELSRVQKRFWGFLPDGIGG